MTTVIIAILKMYQKTLSPDHGWVRSWFPYGYCQFYPSCSTYAIEAFARHGTLRGMRVVAGRLLRCHPWSRGGIDHVPTH